MAIPSVKTIRERLRLTPEKARELRQLLEGKRTSAGKKYGRSMRGMGGVVAPTVDERWDPAETVGVGGVVAPTVKETW